MLTTWGYTLTDVDALPDMMTVEEYVTYTGRSDNTDRVSAEISSACAAIRNFVGWHLGPAEKCALNTTLMDRRCVGVDRDLLIQLPARLVTLIESVTIDDIVCEKYRVDQNGLLRIYDVAYFAHNLQRYSEVVVKYTAGLDDALLAPIKELIAHRVTHAMAVPPGITSEASGGVSVTYNANWINNSRATALAGDNKELLVPYKVQGVF